MGGIVFRVEKSWRSWLNMHRASVCAKGSAPVNTDGGLQSEAPSRVYSPNLIWDGDLISPRGWAGRAGRAGLTSLTSPLRDQHLRVMRATASVTHFNFLLSPLLSILSREPFSVSPFHPPPLPAFFFFFLLSYFSFLSLLRKQFEAKDAWLRATRACVLWYAALPYELSRHAGRIGLDGRRSEGGGRKSKAGMSSTVI